MDALQEQLGDKFWMLAIVGPLILAVFLVQVFFKVRDGARAAKALVRSFSGTLVTDREQPLQGSLPSSLAVGAHMSLNHGIAWNSPTDTAHSAQRAFETLREQWGIDTGHEFRETMESLLDAESGDPLADFVLELRHTHAIADVARWRTETVVAARAVGMAEDDHPDLLRAIDRIAQYEARFRADGILAPGQTVRSVLAYDWGRAVNMARWGHRIGFIDDAELHRYILRAGNQAFSHYDSWAALSAGYCLGRVLRFDGNQFAEWYQTVLEPHTVLTTNATSPWLTLPWPASPARA